MFLPVPTFFALGLPRLLRQTVSTGSKGRMIAAIAGMILSVIAVYTLVHFYVQIIFHGDLSPLNGSFYSYFL